MNSQKVKLDACYLQLGMRKTAMKIKLFESCFALLRILLPVVVVLNLQRLLDDNEGRILFVAALIMMPVTEFVCACEMMLKNRWFYCCRAKKRRRFSTLLTSFSRDDFTLALRVRAFGFRKKAVRVLVFFVVPAALGLFSFAAALQGVSHTAFFVLSAGTALAAAISAVFSVTATCSVSAVASLCRTQQDADNMKSSLHLLDESCFELMLFNCSLAALNSGCRTQAKMLYALEILNQESSAWQSFRRSIHA